jgi:6-phosphogluconolactonase
MKRTLLVLAIPIVASVVVSAQRGGGAGGRGSGPSDRANPFLGNSQAVDEGREIYNRTCTTCHGPDGAGGEMGPALGAPARRYAQATDTQIFDAIKNGIAATPMPRFGSRLPDDDIWRVAAYIRGLRGTAIDAPAAGDVARGEQIFRGKGECGNCHVVNGKGGLIGPDLTNLAGTRKTASIVDALSRPLHKVFGDGGAIPRILIPNATYQPVRVTTADGNAITGVLKNEDSYSLQVMGTDNRLHMFDRAKVKVVYESRTLMPTDYDQRLAPDEFKNLLAYLTRLHVPAPPPPPGRGGPAVQQSVEDYFVFVGSYTNPTPTTTSGAKGIYGFRFDSRTGTLSPIGLAAETVNPAHVWAHPTGRFLYAANWETGDKIVGDTVSAFAVDQKAGTLKLLNRVSAHGDRANQVVLDPSGTVAVTVTYNSGTVTAYGVETDGRLSEAFYTDQHAGRPLSPRQPGPRAHGVVFSKDSRFAYVAELGLDRVYSYRLDTAGRTMTPFDPPYVSLKAGSGPRRLQLHPNGRFLYVNHETDSAVSVFEVNGGSLKEIQSLSTLPADYKGSNTTAEIQIDGEGRFLYVTNRGHDTIAVYSVDPAKGTLTMIENVASLGRTPRNITIDPTNAYLISANQGGENVVVFRLDHKTGHLTPTGSQQPVPQAGGVAFVKAQ